MATGYNGLGSTAALFTNGDPTKTMAVVLLEGAQTAEHYSIVEGVKYKTIIPFISNADVDVSTGNQSGYTLGSDGVTVKDITLEDIQLSIKGSYDPWTIQHYLLGLDIPGSDAAKGTPASSIILDLKGKALRAFNEKFIWQSNNDVSTGGSGIVIGSTMNQFDGILAQVKGVAGGYGRTAGLYANYTDASILDSVQYITTTMQTGAPQLIDMPTVLSMSPGNFAAYSRTLYSLNGAISTLTVGANGKGIQEVYVPGTQIKVVSEIGLTGTNVLFLTYPENVKVVTDLKSEDDKLIFFYSQDADKWIMRGNYKLGVKVADPSMCFVSA